MTAISNLHEIEGSIHFMTELHQGVRIERNVLIPLSDGVTLAADLFLPDTPGQYPALVSLYPYHKDDVIGALFDHPNRYFAARGYASLLVDLRGLGNSGGVVTEYRGPHEGGDGAEIVEWAADQPWCDGAIGMWGMSYGGATTLQVAAQRPPHLKAIVPMNATLSPYSDSVYPGSCLACLGMFGMWAPWMLAMSLVPPMYHDATGRWSGLWIERLKSPEPPCVFPFQSHRCNDEFWQSKTIPAQEIRVPAYFMTAWRDQNPGAMLTAYDRVRGPRKLLVGPWMHWLPDLAAFHRVDYLHEMARWWDRWLRDQPTGIDDEPAVTWFVQGEGWRHDSDWPVANTETQRLFFRGDGGLSPQECPALGSIEYRADPTVGFTAGLWDPAGIGLGLPRDQGPDDLRSITVTSEPLPAALRLIGTPAATIHVALDEGAEANLVVKLCDVAPNNASALITSGWGKAHVNPDSPERGKFQKFEIQLVPTAYLVPAGHRVRVAISCADFPRIWPTPTNPLIRLAFGGEHDTSVILPVVAADGVPGPELPTPDTTVNRTPLDIEGTPTYRVEHDFSSGSLAVSVGIRSALRTPARDGRFQMDRVARASVAADRPHTASVRAEATLTSLTPSGSTVVVTVQSWMSLTAQSYSGRVVQDGHVVFEGRWR